ncbi:MAG: Uma2 family endonuclease, partial [Chloroflexota bacterium]|nr:Uma2 family endonuclease [Chloroflexota bacterium]
MIHAPDRIMTADEFELYAQLPENADRRLEWHDGEIVELVANSNAARIGARFTQVVGNFVEEHQLGEVTNAEGGYRVNGAPYMPDAGYVSYARQPQPPSVAYNPLAPDLAIEVISPSDRQRDIRRKIVNYAAAGTVLWLVDPADGIVEVYTPGQSMVQHRADDTLDGGAVLPGFSVALARIFRPAVAPSAAS